MFKKKKKKMLIFTNNKKYCLLNSKIQFAKNFHISQIDITKLRDSEITS